MSCWAARQRGSKRNQRVYPFRNRSAEEFADFFLTNYGPSERAAAGLDGDVRAAFCADLVALAAAASRLPADGAVAISAMYLETIVSRA